MVELINLNSLNARVFEATLEPDVLCVEDRRLEGYFFEEVAVYAFKNID